MIDLTTLDKNEKLQLLKLLIDELGLPTECFQCHQIVFTTITCESYKTNHEECCKNCAVYCKCCNAYYCEQGEYHHNMCEDE